jgi:nucleoredoxin
VAPSRSHIVWQPGGTRHVRLVWNARPTARDRLGAIPTGISGWRGMRMASEKIVMRSEHLPFPPTPARCPRWISAGIGLCGWLIVPALFGAGGAPLEPQEIGLMLRAGYTSGEVLQEVETRHLVEPLDAATEKSLRDAGADQHLIAALESGAYTLAPSDSAAAKQRQEQAAARVQSDREAGQDRLLEQAREQAQAAISRKMANSLHGKLVIWKDGQLQQYDENILSSKKVFLLYYSASWCAPGRQFTPWLIDFYQKFAPAHPEFEIIYVSDDRSAEEMADYMKTSGMPWPALAYSITPQQTELTKYAGPAIPSMALLDGAGGLHSYSYDGKNYLGPRHVISDLAKAFNVQINGDLRDPPPTSAQAPPVNNTVGRAVTLSGQPQ